MAKKITFTITIIALLLVFVWSVIPVTASPQQPQALYYTPTAGPDNRIIYIVKPGENCISISLLNKVTVDELRLLNNLDDACTLFEGQELLLGVYQETTPTVGMMATPTPLLALATPFSGNAEVCIFLFVDVNGNAMAEENEMPLAGGAVSLADPIGTVSRTGETTAGPDPLCFNEVPEGEYNISVAIPDGYNATTVTNYLLNVTPGDQIVLDFGAQPKGQSQEVQPENGGRDRDSSPLLAIFGGIMVLAGIGMGIYVKRLAKSQ